MVPTMKAHALLAALTLSLAGCAKPEPPQLTPVAVALTGISSSGMDVLVKLDAHNPNRIDLSGRRVSAKLTLDGKVDGGTVRADTPFTLPAQKTTRLDMPLSVQWSNVAGVAALAMGNRPIPYRIEGTVEMGGDTIHIDVPFRVEGTLAHDEIVKAALGSLPKIPGIPGLPALPAPR
jgi:LEA14-like dessication related protein